MKRKYAPFDLIVRSILAAVLVVLPGTMAGSVAARADGSLACIDDWSDAARIVDGEALAQIGAVARTTHNAGYAGVLSTKLCRSGSKGGQRTYVYVVVAREKSGGLKRIVLDAKSLRLSRP